MACCLAYLAAVLALEAYPVKMHFMDIIGHARWDMRWLSLCVGGLVALSAAAIVLPWKMGLKAIETYEV